MSNEESNTGENENEEVEIDTQELDSPEAELAPEEEALPQEGDPLSSMMPPIFLMPPMGGASSASTPPPIRTTGIIGAVDEDKTAELLGSLIKLVNNGVEEVEVPIEKCADCKCDPACESTLEPIIKTVYKPIEMIISTQGGSATEMFSIYDMMKFIQRDFEIHTLGIGKVMSAGVLILAAGTKGKRKIGANCRVMIHSVIGGAMGPLHNMENEMEEIRHTQKAYFKALSENTNMTMDYLNDLARKKMDIYLTAQEAVALGIADEIL
jgi:ATP-dependent Clp endopeptidase proteolytic subunit ClpP